MKLLFLGLAFLATAYAQYSSEYQIPDSLAVLEEIETLGRPQHALADDGYRYKTVKRFRARHRRDVNELSSEYLPPNQEYLPPTQEYLPPAPSNEYLAPSAPHASGVLADDGYRYKAIRRSRLRLRHRHRRDVNELSSAQYLPPVEHVEAHVPSNEYLAPIAPAAPVADIPTLSNEYLAPIEQNENILADDGYRYRTVKRFRIRRY